MPFTSRNICFCIVIREKMNTIWSCKLSFNSNILQSLWKYRQKTKNTFNGVQQRRKVKYLKYFTLSWSSNDRLFIFYQYWEINTNLNINWKKSPRNNESCLQEKKSNQEKAIREKKSPVKVCHKKSLKNICKWHFGKWNWMKNSSEKKTSMIHYQIYQENVDIFYCNLAFLLFGTAEF